MNPKSLSNAELLAHVRQLAQGERAATAALIAHLGELDERRLYLAEGCSSLFTHCTQILHLSEHAAYGRIEAARAVRRFPIILRRLEDGSVNLTTVSLLTAHLTVENHQELLEAAQHKSRRQVEELVARLCPLPPTVSSIRRLPITRAAAALHEPDTATRFEPSSSVPQVGSRSASSALPETQRAAVKALAPQRYKVQFTASPEMIRKLRQAQNLLRHQIPDGDPAAIFDRALTSLLETLAKQKLAATNHPRETQGTARGSRRIPAAVRRAVWLRDGGRCAFQGSSGRHCTETGFLEFHHVRPYAAGGEATADNIQLRCRAHNGHEAELCFGPLTASRVKEERPT